MDEQIVAGIDIGTTKVCAVVGATDSLNRINVLGVGLAESRGLNRGVVVNIDQTVSAVKEAVRAAERAAGVTVDTVIAGIAGDHVQSRQERSVVTIAHRHQMIRRSDVKRLIDDTTRVALPADREILHVIPQEYIVDGQDGVLEPVGMSGLRLEANVHVVTGLVSAAQNIYRCIEMAGFGVDDIVLEPLASSFAVLDEEEKELGVSLIDIGGGTTDVAVFEESTVRHTAVIAVAGNSVTDDIRKGLRVKRSHAENLKCKFGSALVDAVIPDEVIRVPGIGGRPDKEISRSVLSQVIQPRMEEILEIARNEIKSSGFSGSQLGAGAVLTGGGSLIPGTAALASEILGMETRVGVPSGLAGGLVAEVTDPRFATGVGLVLYGLRPSLLADSQLNGRKPALHRDTRGFSLRQRIAMRMKSWFDEL